jgi:hypothetical protein
LSTPKCDKGHSYALRNGILDLLSVASDENILEEEKHWDRFAQRDRLSISPNSFMKEKIFEQASELPDITHKTLFIAEIGCGTGSAIQFLGDLVLFNC